MHGLRALWVVVALGATGCLSDVVALEPKAGGVKIVHETDKPLHCDVLGKISGRSRSSDEKEGRTGAENDFRNQAAGLKANFALIETERSAPVGTGSQREHNLQGKALACRTEEMEAEQEKAEAAAREAKEKAAAEEEAKAEEEKKAKKAKK
jgi:hypothetical protein